MCPNRTSRPICTLIACTPENVPPPTMFLQVSDPNCITSSSTLRNCLVCFLSIRWQLVHQPHAGTAPSSSQEACFPGLGREQADTLRPVTPLSEWRDAGCPAQDDLLAQRKCRLRRDMEGDADSTINKNRSVFIWEIPPMGIPPCEAGLPFTE